MTSIFQLITGLAYGGAETQLVQFSIGLKKRGWNVVVITMLPPQAFTGELNSAGIPVYSLNMCRGIPDPRALIYLLKLLKKSKPDILHSHNAPANFLSRGVRLFSSVKIVVNTAHSINEGGYFREIVYRFSDPLSDLLTQVSREGYKKYLRLGLAPFHKIQYVPNGVDPEQFKPRQTFIGKLSEELSRRKPFSWLAVGRFEEAKDYPNMLMAFAKVFLEEPNSCLRIAGCGPLMAEVKILACRLGIETAVEFLGLRRDVVDLMHSASGYLMSSAWEGMPKVLLEASSVGLPIVATDVGGNREVVVEDKSGYLVPAKDPESLKNAMLRLMRLLPEQRFKMGLFGRDHTIKKFSMDRILDQWEEIYKSLLLARSHFKTL